MGRLIDADALRHEIHCAYSDDLGILEHIDAQQTVDAVPVRHGSWIGGEIGQCSVCGYTGCASDIWNTGDIMFCPNCGARMDGRGNGNEAD